MTGDVSLLATWLVEVGHTHMLFVTLPHSLCMTNDLCIKLNSMLFCTACLVLNDECRNPHLVLNPASIIVD